MSLLDALQKKRSQLKPITTIVTTVTGDKFLEKQSAANGKEIVKINERSHGFVVDTKPDFVPACVINEFLYFGSQDSVTWNNIAHYKISHILSIGIGTSLNLSSISSLHTRFISCLDLPSTDLLQNVLPQSIDFIESCRSQNGKILVHCNAGVSRSASIVIGYLMKKQQCSFKSAYEKVKSKRECIQPNSGFLEQLKSLEK